MHVREHLLARHGHAHRTFELLGGEHRQIDLVLRPQAGAEGAADKRIEHAHVLGAEAEHAREIALDVLRALILVVDRDPAVALPDHGGAVHLHGIVMFGGEVILAGDPHRRVCISGLGIAAVFAALRSVPLGTLVQCIAKVGVVLGGLVFDRDQRGGMARRLECLGDDQRDRLAAEMDLVVIERAQRNAAGAIVVLIAAVLRIETRGRFSWVMTSTTPGTARAAAVSIATMRPLAMAARHDDP